MPQQLLECGSDAIHGASTCLTVSLCWAQLFCQFDNKIPFWLLLANIANAAWVDHAWSISSAVSAPPLLVLQPLRCCCVDCVIHHERDVREEQKYMYVAWTSNNRVIPMEWFWWVTSNNACEPGEHLIVLANGDDENDLVGWSLLLLAATVWSFAHMPLGISDRNTSIEVRCVWKDRSAVLCHPQIFWKSIPCFYNSTKKTQAKECFEHFFSERKLVIVMLTSFSNWQFHNTVTVLWSHSLETCL